MELARIGKRLDRLDALIAGWSDDCRFFWEVPGLQVWLVRRPCFPPFLHNCRGARTLRFLWLTIRWGKCR